MPLRESIAAIILRDLFDDDQEYWQQCLECADSIIASITDDGLHIAQ